VTAGLSIYSEGEPYHVKWYTFQVTAGLSIYSEGEPYPMLGDIPVKGLLACPLTMELNTILC